MHDSRNNRPQQLYTFRLFIFAFITDTHKVVLLPIRCLVNFDTYYRPRYIIMRPGFPVSEAGLHPFFFTCFPADSMCGVL